MKFSKYIVAVWMVLAMMVGGYGVSMAQEPVDPYFVHDLPVVQDDFGSILVGYPYVRLCEADGSYGLTDTAFFKVTRSVVFKVSKWELADDEQLIDELEKVIVPHIVSKGWRLRALEIRGAASPEGSWEWNKTLANKRANTLQKKVLSLLPDYAKPGQTDVYSIEQVEDYPYLLYMMEEEDDIDCSILRNVLEENKGNDAAIKRAMLEIGGPKHLMWSRLQLRYFARLRAARIILWVEPLDEEELVAVTESRAAYLQKAGLDDKAKVLRAEKDERDTPAVYPGENVGKKDADSDAHAQQQKTDSLARAQQTADSLMRAQQYADSLARAQQYADSVARAQQHVDSLMRAQQYADSVARAQQTADSVARAQQHADSLMRAQQYADSVAHTQQTADSLMRAQQAADSGARAQQYVDSLMRAQQYADSLARAQQYADSVARAQQTADSLMRAQQTADSLMRAQQAADSVARAQQHADSLMRAQENQSATDYDTVTWFNRKEVLNIKTNLLFDFAYVPQYGFCPILNAQIEYYPKHGRFTPVLSFDGPWWSNKRAEHKYFQVRNYQVEGRCYFRKEDARYDGFYAGVYGHGMIFGVGFNDAKGYQGEGWGAGISGGYVLPLIKGYKHIKLEFGVQVGYFQAKYDPYVYGCPVEDVDDTKYYYNYTGNSEKFQPRLWRWQWFGPTRVGVSFSYDLMYRKIQKKGWSFKWREQLQNAHRVDQAKGTQTSETAK